jgi:hypothetical protein
MNNFELKIHNEMDKFAGSFAKDFLNGNRKSAIGSLLSLNKAKALMVMCCLASHLDKSDMDIVYKLLLDRFWYV